VGRVAGVLGERRGAPRVEGVRSGGVPGDDVRTECGEGLARGESRALEVRSGDEGLEDAVGDDASGFALGGAKRYSSIGGRFAAESISDLLLRRRANGQPDIIAVEQTCFGEVRMARDLP